VLGRIDILVNNAGGLVDRHALVDVTEEFYRAVLDVNVLTTILCCRAVAPRHDRPTPRHDRQRLVARGAQRRRTRCVDLRRFESSGARAHQGLRKGAGATRHPRERGVAGTDWQHAFHSTFTTPDAFQQAVKTIPLGRAGEPDDVGAVIAFLAGDEASFITGETIEINGGMAMR